MGTVSVGATRGVVNGDAVRAPQCEKTTEKSLDAASLGGTRFDVVRPMSTPTPRLALKLFNLLVNTLASVLVALLPRPTGADVWTTTLILAGLAAFAGYNPVHIASLRTRLIATHPFVFCALATVGPLGAMLVALTGLLGTLPLRTGMDTFRTMFNVGAVTLSTAITAWVFLLSGGVPGAPLRTVLGPLAAGATAYFLINTGLVAKAISMDKALPFLEAWHGCVQWTTLSFFSGMALASGLVLYMEALGDWGLALGVPPCFLLISFYRAFKDRTEEQERRLREMREMNAGLELRVKERTGELEEALEQVRKLQALRATLSQTLIHDLKNPLAVVVGNLDLLEMKGEPRTLHLVRRSKAGASRLLGMILDLLDISGMEENRFVVREDPVNLVEVVRNVAADNTVSAAERRVSIEVHAPQAPAIVAGDASVLRRVLENLLANAMNYTPTGSTISLGLESEEGKLHLTVADQGPGIPETYRGKVFEKFSQGECRAAGVSANRGLGLTFCRMAVEAHGGTIGVEDAPGGGALMRVRLPLGAALDPPVDVVEDEMEAAVASRPQLALVG